MKNKMAIVSIYIMMLFPIMSLTLGVFMLLVRSRHILVALSLTLISSLLIGGLLKGIDYVQKDGN